MKTIITFSFMLIGIMLAAQDLSNAEYYFDHDPGYGNATQVVMTGDNAFFAEAISSAGLTSGHHRFYLRLKDADDRWGMDETLAFFIREDNSIVTEAEDPITGYEFFIGDDPGVGNGAYVDIENGDTLAIENWIISQSLIDGTHALSMRLKSDLGVWGLSEWVMFEYLSCSEVQIQLDGESEFCFDNGTEISFPDSLGTWYWNTYDTTQTVTVFEEGQYYGSAYDAENHICYLSDTITTVGFNQPDPTFTFTPEFNTVEFTANETDQNLFWHLNDEVISVESSFSYTFLDDGWQNICLEATNVCGAAEFCDSLITCTSFETPPYWYLDADDDGFGNETDSIQACAVPEGYAANNEDCDDDNDEINPEAEEIGGDEIDQNCDGDDFPVGLESLSAANFNVFPNPTNGLLNVSFAHGFTGEAHIYDTHGKLVFQSTLDGETEMQFDLEQLGTGFYLLRIFNQDQQALSRISKL